MTGLTSVLAALLILSGGPKIERIDPPHWWASMGVDSLELLVEGSNLIGRQIRVKGQGVSLIAARPAENKRYIYVTLSIARAAPAQAVRIIADGPQADTAEFILRPRTMDHSRIGLDPSDVMYLIMVDRFANGDTSNDVVRGMRQSTVDRKDPLGRHGGDLRGVRDRVGYLDTLGVTALWLCPILENDQPRTSYHGYAITDHYRVDPRLGANRDYTLLAEELHRRRMRLVMDVVLNHVGDQHRLFVQPPSPDWINQWSEYTQTSGRENTNFDPYATEQDKMRFRKGWFDRMMPDLNTTNPHVRRYLLQNTLWWIEEAGVDALRVDTWTYPDQEFANMWTSEVRRVYPGIFIFGETWVDSHASQAFYLEKFPFNPSSRLQSTTDFQTYNALREVLTEKPGWDVGVGRLYRTLAADYLYAKPGELVTFLDNHDLPRIAGVVNGDVQKLRIGLALLLSIRGIPCITYGTECGFASTADHGTIRQDMPGGWPGDTAAFGRPLNKDADQWNEWLRRLLQFRRQHTAMQTGTMKHITPENGVYAVTRANSKEIIACIVNTDNTTQTLSLKRLDDVLKGSRRVRAVPSGREYLLTDDVTLAPYASMLMVFDAP
ncbi:MAG: hypothetical protein FGM33_02325 [Candidatus Kapabacteria bacterium]|nr:hypothetical protein [Candidatus Kapabacteria bacterium]